MEKELKTIKILPETVVDLNFVSALTGEKQYQVVWRLAKAARIITQKKLNKNVSTTKAKMP